MEEILIGSYIRQKRIDKGWSQAYLCENICEQPTLSRIENNERAPSASVVNALLQKLGLPAGQFFALLSRDDLALENLEQEIRNDRVRFRQAAAEKRPQVRAEILEKLEKLEALGGEDNRFVRQFTLSTQAAIGTADGPYSFDEQLTLLLEAIRLTIPRFDLEKISQFQYSMTEVTIINQIALAYRMVGENKEAINIYRRLLQYLEGNYQNLIKHSGQFTLVSCNCAIALAAEKEYEQAVRLSREGLDVCIRSGNYQCLPGFLAILAECYYFMGNREESARLYCQAYSIFDVVHDEDNLAIMRREMKERLGLEPPYQLW